MNNHSFQSRLVRIAILVIVIGMLFVYGLSGCGPAAPVVMKTPTPAAAPTTGAIPDVPPAIPETRMLTLEYPPKIRAGDSDVVRLTLEMDDRGNLTPTVSSGGNVIEGQVLVIPNLFDTHNVLAEARLDMAGVDVRPPDNISETLLPHQKVTFYWSILPNQPGKYKGTVWFFLRFIPKAGGAESRQAISAQTIEIEGTSFFGLGARPTRWLGIAGTVVSSFLGFPFLESIIKWIWKRFRSK